MKIEKLFSTIYLILGLVTILAGIIHFLKMGYLTHWVSGEINPENSGLVVGAFQVNHITSGVLVILIGLILAYASLYGLGQGKQWGLVICLLTGLALIIMSLSVWLTLPKQFLTAPAFVLALGMLMGVGVLVVIPLLIFWKQFNQV